MKIFVDAYILNKEPQGTKTYIKELYKEFSILNPDVNIYLGCFNDNALKEEFKFFKNIYFINLKSKNRVYRMVYEIPKLIKKHQFNFAHFQYVIPFLKSKNCKYIVTIHDLLFNDFKDYFSWLYRIKRNFLFKKSAKRADFLVTVSNYSKERIKEQYKLQNKEIYITPNGVGSIFFEVYDKQKSIEYVRNKFNVENYILYVSRVEPRKNQQLLLKSFIELEDKELKLVFLGKKTLKNKKLNDKIYNISKEDKKRIFFFEDIEGLDLVEFYRAAKVFVYPSLAEGFGIPPIEAGALKVPVLCSNKTAMKEFTFFKPYHINIKDQSLFQEKLTHFLSNYSTLKVNETSNFIKENYTWKNAAIVLTKIVK